MSRAMIHTDSEKMSRKKKFTCNTKAAECQTHSSIKKKPSRLIGMACPVWLPLQTKDATVLFLIVMESAFDNLNLIVNYPVDQSVFLVNSSGPKAGIIKF